MMRVKFFADYDRVGLENAINLFMRGHIVNQISYSTAGKSPDFLYSAMIVYEGV